MPSIPMLMVALRAGLMTVRTRYLLNGQNRAMEEQEARRLALLATLARTVYGKQQGVEERMPLKVWRERVPLCDYAAIEPYIERMKNGETDVLWPGRCGFYAVSAGTTSGKKKYVPVSNEMGDHFRQAMLDSLLFYTARTDSDSIFYGKHLYLGGVGLVSTLPEDTPPPAFAGDMGDILELSLSSWVEEYYYEPGHEIARMSDWTEKVGAMIQRCLDRDIRLINGMPIWVLVFGAAVLEEARRQGRKAANLKELWPNLACVVHGGMPALPYKEQLRRVCGEGVTFHEVYPSVEGFIAAQDAGPEDGMRLMCDTGVYFEFIPLAEYDEDRSSQPGIRAVGVGEVKTGVDYVLIMTTPAGLCRYVSGDVVRFISTEPPRLVYEGRTRVELNAFGERVVEREITAVLSLVCRRNGWDLVNFHVAPVFANSLIGHKHGCHEWWVELRAGTEATPTGLVISEELDQELCKVNKFYEAKRREAVLSGPTVRLVMPGVFEHWQREAGCWGGQYKMPRCREDRRIADELARVARFHDSR
jgi:hypothetical protein